MSSSYQSSSIRPLEKIREYLEFENNDFLQIITNMKSTRSQWLEVASMILEDPDHALRQLSNLDLFERTLFNLKITHGETALKAYRILLAAPHLNRMSGLQLAGFNIGEISLYMMKQDPYNATHEEFRERTELFYDTNAGQNFLEAQYSDSQSGS